MYRADGWHGVVRVTVRNRIACPERRGLLHRELVPRVGPRLATERHRCLAGLPPRQLQTLHRLLAGDSEKQVAEHLGQRQPAVHEYVTALHRRFRVKSRGELLAYFLARRPVLSGGEGTQLSASTVGVTRRPIHGRNGAGRG